MRTITVFELYRSKRKFSTLDTDEYLQFITTRSTPLTLNWSDHRLINSATKCTKMANTLNLIKT